MDNFVPSPYCIGKPHQRIAVIKRVPTPGKPLLIREVGICKRCHGRIYYEHILDAGVFHGSLESNPQVYPERFSLTR